MKTLPTNFISCYEYFTDEFIDGAYHNKVIQKVIFKSKNKITVFASDEFIFRLLISIENVTRNEHGRTDRLDKHLYIYSKDGVSLLDKVYEEQGNRTLFYHFESVSIVIDDVEYIFDTPIFDTAYKSFETINNPQDFKDIHVKSFINEVHESKETSSEWVQGYACAVAVMLKMEGTDTTPIRELFSAGIGSMEIARASGVNQYDLDVLQLYFD
jgi:hypothetical protein